MPEHYAAPVKKESYARLFDWSSRADGHIWAPLCIRWLPIGILLPHGPVTDVSSAGSHDYGSFPVDIRHVHSWEPRLIVTTVATALLLYTTLTTTLSTTLSLHTIVLAIHIIHCTQTTNRPC